MEDGEQYRTSFQVKLDECESKRRENDLLTAKVHELETKMRSSRDANDLQKQLDVENEVNRQELKRKQDDFEHVQRVSRPEGDDAIPRRVSRLDP